MPKFTVPFLLCFFISPGVFGQYTETQVQPTQNDRYKSAKYRLWLPPNVSTVRGIIIKQHGCGVGASSHGLNHANDLQWQTLAQKHQMALLGTELTNNELCAQWFNLEGGSDKALVKALEMLAITTHHPELTTVPWALWGHSGGGFWCTGMLFAYPERILCAIPRSGGYASMQWNAAVKQIPVMWMAGEMDIVDNQEYVKALTLKSFTTYRRLGALWGVAIDPKADHGNRDGRRFYIKWMDAVLSLRLAEKSTKPMHLDSLKGWLGQDKTYEIKPFAEVKENRNQWIWLPSESTARDWQEFVKTGGVTDLTPPPAPHQVILTRHTSGKFILEWEADVDLESGIKLFNIYRNDALLGTVAGQKSNFHDAPEPATVKFEYNSSSIGKNDRITVAAVNHQNLESNKTAALLRK